jgi:hypothetical protein
LRTALVDAVAATNPGYTANLPGTLIEDVTSTDMGAIITLDQARVDAVNNTTPYASAPYILAQQGAMYGLMQGLPTNASVYVVFSGPAGYVIAPGFVVSDGTNQYHIQDGGIIGTSGASAPLYCVAVASGSWAILAGSVTTVVTSVPSGYTITVTNPLAGVPGGAAESVQSYRARNLQAARAFAQGSIDLIKTALQAIPGVVPRLVSVRQTGGSWEIICGGGDPYAVAYAIYRSTLHFPMLMGSMNNSQNVTVSIINPPNVYQILFVNPMMATTTVSALWNTDITNFTAVSQVNQLGSLAIQGYINGISVGEPINLMQLGDAFQEAVSSVLSPRHLSSLEFTVSVGGTTVGPNAGTNLIASMPEQYFSVAATDVTVAQG